MSRSGSPAPGLCPGVEVGCLYYTIRDGRTVELTAILSFWPLFPCRFFFQLTEHFAQRQAQSRQYIAAIERLIFVENLKLIRRSVDTDVSFTRIDYPCEPSAATKVFLEFAIYLCFRVLSAEDFHSEVRIQVRDRFFRDFSIRKLVPGNKRNIWNTN